ncbi:hypothetical protein EXIGLDRAFT_696666 [Exidia glandulosa HHB12029]|uniref:Uncharacterized protein n=1 Tax=Exidia glandulosa HHB12029 TaxID=1314781 RepID=A0A165F5Q5_EXIGL|nr:hypothetical protein EXIGLDRAFT_696666 [Exidia glandulosa HHB12029]
MQFTTFATLLATVTAASATIHLAIDSNHLTCRQTNEVLALDTSSVDAFTTCYTLAAPALSLKTQGAAAGCTLQLFKDEACGNSVSLIDRPFETLELVVDESASCLGMTRGFESAGVGSVMLGEGCA